MPTLVFPSPEALRLVLTSGLLPAEVQAAPARVQSSGPGVLRVTSSIPLGRDALKTLAELGIHPEETVSGAGMAVSCWAELVPLGRTPGLDVPGGQVLFLPADERDLLSLAGELLRLGCERQELCLSGSGTQRRALLRAVAPPYFTLTRAIDHVAGLRAFTPAVTGRSAVWVELGHTHPFVRTLQPPVGTLLLLPGQGGWMTAPDGPWRDLSQFVELQLPEPVRDWAPLPAPGRLAVPLRLSRSARVEAASLWVLREKAVAQMETLVNSVPEAVLARLRFAVAGSPESPLIVLRARQGRERPPELGLEGTAYAPLPQLPHLYLPCDARLEPPLSGERLRGLFTSEAESVTWLNPTAPGRFRAERLPESAFHPLEEWVDYLLDTAAVALEPWVRGATFDFEDFRAAGPTHVAEAAAAAEPEPPARRRSARRAATAPPAHPPVPREPPTLPVPVVRNVRVVPLTRAQISEAERNLSTHEAAFLVLEFPADAPERLPRWEHMAELNGQLQRPRDAGLCWTRCLWESSGEEARRLAARWAEAVAAEVSPAERLALTTPSEEDVRAFASQVVQVLHGSGAPLDLPAAQRWLDRHDGVLDVRSLWLVRVALARLSGGDALGMAQAADRVLALLHRGLSRSRDVPTFLRAGGAAHHAPPLRLQLGALLERFELAPRGRSPLEAPAVLTQAYVRLIFAWGFARLGLADRARELISLATLVLDAKEPVHGYLVRALVARVEQALEGQPASTPLPDALAAEYAALGTFPRYKVDRLRQAAKILEPDGNLDPTRDYARGVGGVRDELAVSLREERHPKQLLLLVEGLVTRAVAPGLPAGELPRLLELLLDTLPRLPAARALPLLTQLLPAMATLPEEPHAVLLGEALGVAGHFAQGDHVRTLVGRLRALLEGLKPEAEAWRHGILGTCLRDLRRLGLTREITELLLPGRRLLARPEGVPLATQLGIAAGLAQLGQMEEASAVFERAFAALSRFQGPQPERLGVVRGLAGALSHAPADVALPGLARLSDQFAQVTDGYNTNSHFCLSVVELADALVLGHVGVGQGTDERIRRWLDEDEFLVRRRIHRELEEQS